MMKRIFEKAANSWIKTRRGQRIFLLTVFFAFILFFAFGLFSHPVFAATAPGTPPAGPLTVKFVPDFIFEILTQLMLAVTRLALSLMLFVLTFIIQVASYNGYLSSDAVNVGWVMVRDLTNMVFVVALLIIAFGTILGIEHYEWKHMLFKLVAAAVLVNFSRVICGVIIDVAQVVMTTFVNGIAATVGGNFIRAFSLDTIRSFSNTGTATINPEGVYLAAMASLFISVTVLVTSGILLGMLVARVLVLWVLIVLSPIAFVLGVLDQTKSYASEWWSQFGKNVVTGPVLIFFLWLTLVTVGNGLVNKQFAQTPGSINQDAFNNSSGIGQALQWDKLVNFVIAIGMLLVGIKVTQQLGGIGAEWTGKAIDIGKKVTMGVATLGQTREGSFARQQLRTVKAGAQLVGARVANIRNKGAVALEEAARKPKGIWGVLAKGGAIVGGRVIESKGRAEKRISNLEEAAKTTAEIGEQKMGLGGTAIGQMKSKATAELENIKEEKEVERQQKTLRARAELYRAQGEDEKAYAYERRAGSMGFEKQRENTKGVTGEELIAQIQQYVKDLKIAEKNNDTGKIDKLRQKLYVANSSAKVSEPWVGKAADLAIASEMGITPEVRQKMTDQQFKLSLDLGKIITKPEDLAAGAAELERSLSGGESDPGKARSKAQAYLRDRDIARKNGGLANLKRDDAATISTEFVDGRLSYKVFDNPDEAAQREAANKEFTGWAEKISLSSAPNAPISLRGRDDKGNLIAKATEVCKEEYTYLVNNLSKLTGVQYDKVKKVVADLKNADSEFKQTLIDDLKASGTHQDIMEKLQSDLSVTPSQKPHTPSGGEGGGESFVSSYWEQQEELQNQKASSSFGSASTPPRSTPPQTPSAPTPPAPSRAAPSARVGTGQSAGAKTQAELIARSLASTLQAGTGTPIDFKALNTQFTNLERSINNLSARLKADNKNLSSSEKAPFIEVLNKLRQTNPEMHEELYQRNPEWKTLLGE